MATPLVLDDCPTEDDPSDPWQTWTPDPVHARTREFALTTLMYKSYSDAHTPHIVVTVNSRYSITLLTTYHDFVCWTEVC